MLFFGSPLCGFVSLNFCLFGFGFCWSFGPCAVVSFVLYFGLCLVLGFVGLCGGFVSLILVVLGVGISWPLRLPVVSLVLIFGLRLVLPFVGPLAPCGGCVFP